MRWKQHSALHLLHAPLDDVLSILKSGMPYPRRPAGPGVPLVDVRLVAGTRELLGGGQSPAGPEPDDCNLSSCCFVSSGSGATQTFLERLLGDGAFDGLDRDSVVVDVERAEASHGAGHAARHLGEVVGGDVRVDAAVFHGLR